MLRRLVVVRADHDVDRVEFLLGVVGLRLVERVERVEHVLDLGRVVERRVE
jgi:hypothetical protein